MLNEYCGVTWMKLTFSMSTSDETKEAFEINVGHYKSMKIATAYSKTF